MRKLDFTRMADIFFSATFILIVLPVWLIVIPLLRFTGEGEVFYRQPRVGRDRHHFVLLKFATMLKDSPNMGTGDLTLQNDPRVLPMGWFLRKTKINELPQLINVLKGDMSIAGPRPQTPRIFALYPEDIQKDIVRLRPGLSGVGAILFRGEEHMTNAAEDPAKFYAEVIKPYKGRVELWYLHNQSLLSYLLVIFVTVWVIIFSKSRLPWRAFPGLPTPPPDLARFWARADA
ncbi:sugar transferase [Yoonia sp.]|uniref:sugar transferase n=1 Tax=Yoonia sp. TaxID=2212373 RepID=UPI002E07F975|nr:sugar transferase [Yoonia sp.]